MNAFTPFHWQADKRHLPSGQPYTVTLADYVLRGESGEEEATVFSFAYTQDGADRPVLFAYNGGPGSASAWLHMGLLGPKIADFPAYPAAGSCKLVDNPCFLIDLCDIVLIDSPGTGWARLLDADKAGAYYSVGGDARALARFMEAWLVEHGKTGAPVYLLGESYGTIRNLALAEALPAQIDLRGIVHIGVSFNVGASGAMYVEPNVRRLGANAACAWYHKRQQTGISQRDFVQEALAFACDDYARALLLGSRLAPAERARVCDRLSYYSGLAPALLEAQNLRFSEADCLMHLLPGRILSMYDARLSQPLAPGTRAEALTLDMDAFMATVSSALDDAFTGYIAAELAAPPKRALAEDGDAIARGWDYRSYPHDTLALPAALMDARSDLRMLFVSGCYDLTSTFDFVDWYLAQYPLDPARTSRLVLPSGHAAYIGPGMAHSLGQSLRSFVCAHSE